MKTWVLEVEPCGYALEKIQFSLPESASAEAVADCARETLVEWASKRQVGVLNARYYEPSAVFEIECSEVAEEITDRIAETLAEVMHDVALSSRERIE